MSSEPAAALTAEPASTPHRVYPRPERLEGMSIKTQTPFGKAYITINRDDRGNPFEVFIAVGKAGGCDSAQLEGISRLTTLALRAGIDPTSRAEEVPMAIVQVLSYVA